MVSSFISRIVILVFGTLYPAYASYKAVRTKNVREYVKWMMYWIVFALFTCAETFTDLFLSFWFPFYYEIKIITVIYLLSPATKGSSILYRKFVHPVLIKREQEIDEYIAKAKEQGYHTMLNLGSKGVNYATSLIMQTAIKGGGGLVNQLKKSYSLNDLSGGEDLRKTNADIADGPYSEVSDSKLIRRSIVQGPHSHASSTGQTGLYFPEADPSQQPGNKDLRQLPSFEEISSGYPNWEPYYYAMQEPQGFNLVRTASLGPTSRIRTRATTKLGLPKKSSLFEEGSTWSAMEPQSQNETDNHFNYPLSHSASFPFACYPPQHFFLPEYQHLFRNLPQNQILTFINHSQDSKILDKNDIHSENNSERVFEGLNNGNSTTLSVEASEYVSDSIRNQSTEENKPSEVDDTATKNNDEKMVEIRADQTENGTEGIEILGKMIGENELEGDVKNENSEKVAYPMENTDARDILFPERSGRYNKKPAPTPPTEELNSKVISVTAEEEETEFFTPNASPKPERKHSLPGEKKWIDLESKGKPHENNLLTVPKKSKSKVKKTDFNIQKKLHMPKMSFSFWHQKSGKQSSTSESSSVASVEISSNSEKNDLEYFIPLKDDDGRTESSNTTEECKRD